MGSYLMNRMLGLTVLAAVLLGVPALPSNGAHAQSPDGEIKLGVLTDMNFPDLGGAGSILAAKLAIQDFGAEKKGMKVSVIGADHQNKPDVGSSIANAWYDVN